MSGFDHWLDRRAVAIAARGEGSSQSGRASKQPGFEAVSRSEVFADALRSGAERLPDAPDISLAMLPPADHRLTRSTAIKAAAGLLALVGLPAARPSRASAQSMPCGKKCADDYNHALEKRLLKCVLDYGSGWDPGRTLDFLFGGPPAAARNAMRAVCEVWVLRSTENGVNDCFDMCDKGEREHPPAPVCEPAKSARSGQRAQRSKGCASFPPPPPDLKPPSYTPPPDTGCANCTAVGGKCCESADPTKPICICADPGSDCCAVYGCCS
jgi:hypothetical protein